MRSPVGYTLPLGDSLEKNNSGKSFYVHFLLISSFPITLISFWVVYVVLQGYPLSLPIGPYRLSLSSSTVLIFISSKPPFIYWCSIWSSSFYSTFRPCLSGHLAVIWAHRSIGSPPSAKGDPNYAARFVQPNHFCLSVGFPVNPQKFYTSSLFY